MEDAHYLEDGFNGDPHSGFFGVYDGHGGKEAAIFASKHFHNVSLLDRLRQPARDCHQSNRTDHCEELIRPLARHFDRNEGLSVGAVRRETDEGFRCWPRRSTRTPHADPMATR